MISQARDGGGLGRGSSHGGEKKLLKLRYCISFIAVI